MPPAGYAAPTAWPGAWYAPPPGSVVPPVRRRRTGLIIGIVTAVVVLACTTLGTGVFLLRSFAPSAANLPAPGPALTAVATPSPIVILQDPLTSNVNGWAIDGSYCKFAHGGYMIANRICYAPAGNIVNGSVSVEVRQLSGPVTWPMGIVFRRPSQGNYYAFAVDSHGKWVFFKVVNNHGTQLEPYTANLAINRGLNVTNRLRVRFAGTHFDFFVNDVQVGEFDDPTYTSAGLVGLTAGPNIQAVFNNFEVTT